MEVQLIQLSEKIERLDWVKKNEKEWTLVQRVVKAKEISHTIGDVLHVSVTKNKLVQRVPRNAFCAINSLTP